MSSGMLLLAGLFATGPVAAPPCETAPMPRAKTGRIAVEFRVDITPRSLTFGAGVGPAKQPDRLMIAVPALGPNPLPQNSPPPEVRMMMLQAIEQMSGPVATPTPPLCLPPVQATTRPAFVTPVCEGGGHSLQMPFAQFVQQQSCPVAAAPASWTAPVQLGRPMPTGSWTREVGPVRYKLEIKDQTLTVTTTLTEEEDDGRTVSIDHVLTADWYPTRNAGEIVGLVTGFDIATNGNSMKRDDVSGLLGSLADIQKQLSGKPIAMTCRVSDGTLSIGDVRLPALKDDFSELSSAFAAMGGNYKPTVAATTSPTAVTVVPASARGVTPPSPYFLREPTRPHPADPTILVPYTYTSPEPPQRIGVDFNFNPPRFHGYPPMPPPAPLPKTNPFRDGRYNPSVPATWPNPFRDGYFIW